MVISEHLNQQKLKEILIYIVQKGQETDEIGVIEIVEDIKQQIAATVDD
ncbi:hypothetical protein JOD43_002604 [Pullulanibacillus pueri]|uniref:Uncharacterized protein n=1 Tax=Pullulanibacillus pueri TaxID=1437324 RepID=A0A8J2ZW01_9BACL|nr:hypothetical protein [Pullulanibacillus pueri]MBM7682427.1 hypothetical protein [Pullulanibacillus pueri]GGH81681.1 hypothetical protein GCM10007096_19940 [Pullulanibacillus pueri]